MIATVAFCAFTGAAIWLNEKSKPMRYPFLRSPLAYVPTLSDVRSRFNVARDDPTTPEYDPKNHNGVDLRGANGDPLFAPFSGRVVQVLHSDSGGNQIILENGDGWRVGYAHMKEPTTLRPNDKVNIGQQVGMVGSTGRVTGPHLHLTLREPKGAATIDPLPYLLGG